MSDSLKDKTVKGVVWSAVERFSVAGISFAFGLILARLLGPSDYGIIAMLNIFMAISQTFIDSGFSNALIRKPDRTETDNATAFYFNIGVGLFCYLVLFITAPWIAHFYDKPILIPVTRVISLSLLLNSLCVVQQTLITIHLDFKTQAKVSLIATLLSGTVGIILAFAGYGIWSLVVQTVLLAFLRMVLLWILAKWRPQTRFSMDSFQNLFSFGSKLLASGLLDTIYNNLYTIVIGKRFSSSSLGMYSRADHFAQFPATNITGILQRVTFPVLSTIQNEDERLKVNYRKFLRLSAYIIFPVMMILAAIGDPLIRFILTDKWAGSIPLLRILCFSMMWYPIHAINLNLLQVKGRSDLFLKLEVWKKIIGVITLCVTVPLGLTAMCFGRLFISLIALAVNTHYTGKLIHVGFWQQMKDLLPVIVNSTIMFALSSLVQMPFTGSHLLCLTIAITTGTIYYICGSYLFCADEQNELLCIIRKKQH